MNPYVGITGVTTPEQTASALSAFPKDGNRKLMVGVLATWKSLHGIPMKPKWAKQTPDPKIISALFTSDERVLNLVHFSTEEGQENSVLGDMLKIHELAGPNFHGFQLNLVWPGIRLLKEYRETVSSNYRIVLQISREAVKVAGEIPHVIAVLSHYDGASSLIYFSTRTAVMASHSTPNAPAHISPPSKIRAGTLASALPADSALTRSISSNRSLRNFQA